jgi:hypothetical protein
LRDCFSGNGAVAQQGAITVSTSFCSTTRFPLDELGGLTRLPNDPEPMTIRIPQLIRPMGVDQYDNSDRAMRLGAALELLPKNYQVDNIIGCIDRLIDDRNIRIRCSELARRTGYDGVSKTCDHILEAVGSQS